MKIVIATGIFPPDIGGPATYLKRLSLELAKRRVGGWIITYSDQPADRLTGAELWPVIRILRKDGRLIRYFGYFWHLRKLVKEADIIYAQDLFSSGLPSALAKRISSKKLVIRLGGDFLWEKAVNSGWSKKSLRQYYQQSKSLKEKVYFIIARFVFKSADLVIFSTDWQREIYLKYYHLKEKKTKIIENPFPDEEPISQFALNRKIIFAGRLIKLKNVDLLIRVFAQISQEFSDLELVIIGNGPEKNILTELVQKLGLGHRVHLKPALSNEELMREISHSFLFVLPSLTEVSPNLALACIKLKKPILLTQESGLYQKFKESLIFINPFNPSDLEEKIRYLLKEENYQAYQGKISLIPTDYSWSEVVQKHLAVFNKLVSRQ